MHVHIIFHQNFSDKKVVFAISEKKTLAETMHWLFIAHPKSYAKEKFLSWTFCRKTLIYLGQIFLQFLNLMRFRKVPAPPLLFTTICGDQPPIHLEYVQLPKPPKPRHSTWAHLDSTKILVDFMGKCEPRDTNNATKMYEIYLNTQITQNKHTCVFFDNS